MIQQLILNLHQSNGHDSNSKINIKAQINDILKKTNNLIKINEQIIRINQKIDYISSNINSEFKNVAADPNGIIEKKDADIVEVICLYRCLSYFLFGTQNFYLEIKNLIIEWIENNYEKFTSFFGDEDANNGTKQQLAFEE